MLSDEPVTDFVENSGVVGKRSWMFALNAVGIQGLPFSIFVALYLEDRSTVYEIGRCENAAFMLIRKNANSMTDLTTRHEHVEHFEVRVLLFCCLNSFSFGLP